ncbi:MAG: hypothetical protein N2Z40_02080 [Caldimicrobium sp.]|nr:hypothetical protein [Caldimicrobium sp.]
MAVINKIENKAKELADFNRAPKKVLDRDAFMKLFITQLQYQDPMKPIENHEMALQLASFNQVDQLMGLNEKLGKLVDLYKANEYTLLSNLVGKEVKVEGHTIRVEQGQFLGGEFKLEEPANVVNITIRDKQGRIIKNFTLQGLPKGIHRIEWDGRDNNGNQVSDGNYRISITVGSGDTQRSITPLVVAKVTGAILGEKSFLKINEAEEIPLNQIKEIYGR